MIVTMAWLAFAAGLALWAGVYVALLRITRPREVTPGPTVREPGPVRPAVAGQLTTRGGIGAKRAASATLVDLAARGHLRLTEYGNDPRLTMVTIQTEPHQWEDLEPYELRVLARIRELASRDVVRLFRLPFDNRQRARSWAAGMEKEVVNAARDAGLVRERLEPVHRTILLAVSGVPAAALGLAASLTAEDGPVQMALAATVAVLVGLNALLALPLGVKPTAGGHEAAARALAFRDWLQRSSTDPPAAGVTSWGRDEAYGVAFGLNRYAEELIDFGLGRRDLVWSRVTGVWRPIRVRYPDDTLRHGATVRSALSEIISDVGLVVVLSCPGCALLSFLYIAFAQISSGLLAAYVLLVVAAAAYFVVRGGVRWLSRLGQLLEERGTLTVVRGRVIQIRRWRQGDSDDRGARHHLVVDDGSADDLTAWCMTGTPLCATGETVEFTASPWSRRVLEITRRSPPDEGDHEVV